jgi:hypothetical protein
MMKLRKNDGLQTPREVLMPMIKAKNQASDQLKEDPSEYNHIIFCKARSLLNKEKQHANNRLAYKKAKSVMNLMRAKPREVCAMARKLEAGHTSHHWTNQVLLNFSNDGVTANNDKKNLKIACTTLNKYTTGNHYLTPQLYMKLSRDLKILSLTSYLPSKS